MQANRQSVAPGVVVGWSIEAAEVCQQGAYGKVLDGYPLPWKAPAGRLGTVPKVS